MAEMKVEKQKSNGKVEVPVEVLDFIGGLKGGDSGIDILLEQLGMLCDARLLFINDHDRVIGGEIVPVSNCIHIQKRIIKEIEEAINTQEIFINRLKKLIRSPEEYLEANIFSLDALKELTNMFQDTLGNSTNISLQSLKAWAATHGFNFETFKNLLTSCPPSIGQISSQA